MTLTDDTVLAADRGLYTELEEEARQLDDEILQLRQRVSAVREKRNALVCVNRSPDDVLALIFGFLVHPADADCHNYEVVDASHVCRRWRAIALSSPALWTNIPICRVSQAKLFAERSDPMPVNVYQGFSVGLASRVLPPLIPRLRTLFLQHSCSNEWTDLNKAWATRSAPLLEDLFVQNNSAEVVQTYSQFEAPLPALRSLRLDNIFFAPTCPLFQKNLRHLRLVSRAPSMLTIGSYFQMLGQCPDLETLELGPFHAHDPPERDLRLPHPIDLPRLASLELTNIANWLPAALLRNLSLPLSTSLSIVHTETSANGPYPQGLPALPIMAGFRRVAVLCRTAFVHGYRFSFSAYRGTHDDAALPGLRFECRRARGAPLVWLDTLSALLDMRHVERLELRLEGSRPQREQGPRPLALTELTTLTTLSVGGPMSGALHLSLLRDLSADPTGAVAQLACPALEALEFEDPHCDLDFWDALTAMVRDRRFVAPSPFKRVSLKAATGIVDNTHPSVQMMRILLNDFQLSAAESSSIPGPSDVIAEA